MIRKMGIAAAFAVLMMLGLTGVAQSQERPTLVGRASCLDAQGNYVITWTLTLPLQPGQSATAENPAADFEGLDLIGQPQGDNYPFSVEAGNLFTAAWGRLTNGPNEEKTPIDTKVYNPDTITAAGRIKTPAGATEIEVTVNRPAPCTA